MSQKVVSHQERCYASHAMLQTFFVNVVYVCVHTWSEAVSADKHRIEGWMRRGEGMVEDERKTGEVEKKYASGEKEGCRCRRMDE